VNDEKEIVTLWGGGRENKCPQSNNQLIYLGESVDLFNGKLNELFYCKICCKVIVINDKGEHHDTGKTLA